MLEAQTLQTPFLSSSSQLPEKKDFTTGNLRRLKRETQEFDWEMEDESSKAEGVRVFVGGLGESVSSDEVRKIFSALGDIEAVEIIRTKGRSFAYVDFVPASSKSLLNLFNTYNGCVWKGGRLRLEKAKKDYLARMKEEWAQDAAPPPPPPSNESDSSDSKTTHIRMYFPALQKVKQLPYSGSGKHKYSFRRVEVPSLPTHFCDCEVHSTTPPPLGRRQKPVPIDGVSEEELHLMNSVLNKLLEKDEPAKLENDLHEEDPISDEDNIVINVVNQRNSKPLLANEEARFNNRQWSNSKSSQDAPRKKANNSSTPFKSAKPSFDIVSNDNESMPSNVDGQGRSQLHSDAPQACLGTQFVEPKPGVKQSTPTILWSQKKSWKKLVGDSNNSSFNVSESISGIASNKKDQPKSSVIDTQDNEDTVHLGNEDQKQQLGSADQEQQSGTAFLGNDDQKQHVASDDQKQQLGSSKVEELSVAQPIGQDSVSIKSGRGSAWLQKSSWTQLISGNNSSSFSITDILPSRALDKQEPEKPGGIKFPNSGHERSFWDRKDAKVSRNKKARESQVAVSDTKVLTPDAEKEVRPVVKQTFSSDLPVGEACFFMRSADSEKKLAQIKASLNGSLKRKTKG